MKKKNLPLVSFFFFLYSILNCQTVNDVQGNLTHGGTAIVIGLDFKTHPDNNAGCTCLNIGFEDCEDQNLTNILTGTNDVSVGDSDNRPNSSYHGVRDHAPGASVGGMGFSAASVNTNDGYYVSGYIKIPSSVTWASNGQFKLSRVGHGGVTYPNFTAGKHFFTNGTSHLATIEGGSPSIIYNQYLGYNTLWNDGLWHRLEVWFKPSSGIGNADGQIKWFIDNNILLDVDDIVTDNGSSNDYNREWFIAAYYLGASEDCFIDDVYFDYTRARVEIGNDSIFENCTLREIQIPISWAVDTIEIQVNQGAFNDLDCKYLFVIDEFGNISNGFKLNTVPLPIELVDFNVTALEENILLEWSTAFEKNNSGFVIEKSGNLNNGNWEEIGFIESNGNSNIQRNYDFVDENPFLGTNYFRLKIRDLDGHVEYSKIESLNIQADEGINIYPSPAKDFIWIKAKEGTPFQIFDNQGKQALSGVLDGNPIFVGNLSQGVHYIYIDKHFFRFVKN